MKASLFKKKNTTSEIALRKWCIEQAVALMPSNSDDDSVVESAQKIYEWVTSESRQSDQKFGIQLRK